MEGDYYEEKFTYIQDDTPDEIAQAMATEVEVSTEEVDFQVSNIFDRVSSIILSVTALLSLFFYMPGSIFPFGSTKGTIIAVGVILALISWGIARLKSSSVVLPKLALFFPAGAIVIVYLLSGLLSKSRELSLFGQGFEGGTFLAILVLMVMMFLIPMVTTERRDITRMIGFLFVGFTLITLIQLLRLLIGPGFMAFGVLTNPVQNVIGNWNDLGVFFGLVSVMSLVALDQLTFTKGIKAVLWVLLVVSLFFVALINYKMIWIILGLVSLVFFIYSLSVKSFFKRGIDNGGTNKVSVTSLFVFIISLVFVISGGSLGNGLSSAFNIERIEARPSYTSTLAIGKATLKESPLLGVGPNLFTRQWVKNKPAGVNQTLFWNVNFTNGIAFFPSTLTTVGILGALAWIVFLIVFLTTGMRRIFKLDDSDPFMKFITITTFVGAVYLWLFSFFYVPNVVMFGLAFVLSGLFLSTQIYNGRIDRVGINFIDSPKVGFVSVLVTVLLLIVSVTGLYFVGGRYISQVAYSKGLVASNVDGDLEQAEKSFARALSTYETPQYYRTLSNLYLLRVNQIVTQTTNPDETQRIQFQTSLGQAIESAQRATELDPDDYRNWLVLGNVYEAIVPLGIEGSRESAEEAYAKAQELNPTGPSIDLVLGRLALTAGDRIAARQRIEAALQKKNNYTEAVFILSQIEVQDGNIDEAIAATAAAAQLSPNDPTIFFQLGILFYNQDDFTNAAASFERAVSLRNEYSNARYFLGLSYEELGRSADAIVQFEEIEKLNPGNAEVELILSNLRAGLDPFNGAEAPIDNTPELRDDLPIDEEVFEGSSDEISVDENNDEESKDTQNTESTNEE